jgi:hypothetical protein
MPLRLLARAVPPDPALYRLLFFAPLFAVEVTTLFASGVVTNGQAVQSESLFLRIDAGSFRGLGPVWIRLPLHPTPFRPERGVEDPGLRGGAQPIRPPASPGQYASLTTSRWHPGLMTFLVRQAPVQPLHWTVQRTIFHLVDEPVPTLADPFPAATL